MKKTCLLAAVLLAMLLILPAPAGASDVTVYVDESQIAFDVQPMIEAGRTLVPMRAIFEALNCSVEWDEATQTVTAYTEWMLVIELQIGNPTATTYFQSFGDDYDFATMTGTVGKDNLQTLNLDVPAKIVDGRTLVPLRFVGEAMGYPVEWDGERRNVYIGNCEGLKAELLRLEAANKVTLYSEDGRTISVKSEEVEANLQVGWYRSEEEAKKAATMRKDLAAVENFSIGDYVVQNLFLIIRHGYVQDIDYNTGQVSVRWELVTDAAGLPVEGGYGMLYGNLYGTDWVGASTLI